MFQHHNATLTADTSHYNLSLAQRTTGLSTEGFQKRRRHSDVHFQNPEEGRLDHRQTLAKK
jgi:hypothetical protein